MVARITRARRYVRCIGDAFGHGGEGKAGKGSVPLHWIKNWGSISAIAAMILFAGTAPAQAYLEPGTGSIILQAVIGAIAGGLVVARVHWDRIKLFLKRKNDGDGRSDDLADRK